MAAPTKILFADSQIVDAFDRLRVSNPEALVALQAQYDNDPLEIESGFTGTGVVPTHNINTRMVRLAVNAGSGTSFSQTYNYWVYQPGRSQFISMTGAFGAPIAGAQMDFGYFDAASGIMYRQTGLSGASWVLRSSTSGSPVESVVPQVSWNIDPFDGTGPSAIVLDKTKVFIIVIDLEYLGMGRVRVGFTINGVIHYAHQFLHSNVISGQPYMSTASLPTQVLVTGTALGSSAEAFAKGVTVISEGGLLKELGYSFSTGEGTATAPNGTRTHLLTIRPKTTFKGQQNRQLYDTTSLGLMATGANPFYWELVAGANFSVAPTFADVNTNFSGTEYGTGGTFLNLTGGLVLASGYADNQTVAALNHAIKIHTPIALNRAGANTPMGTLSILVSGITGNAQCRGIINFTELR